MPQALVSQRWCTGGVEVARSADREAAKAGHAALSKIKLLPLVERMFKQRALRQTLLDFDALDLVREWLQPQADGSPPALRRAWP